jgi:hypothetical protein
MGKPNRRINARRSRIDTLEPFFRMMSDFSLMFDSDGFKLNGTCPTDDDAFCDFDN